MDHFNDAAQNPNPIAPSTMMIRRFYKVLNADEGIKRRLCLGNRTAAEFAVTATQPEPHSSGDEPTPGVVANGLAWMSNAADNSNGRCELQEVLDAMTVVGVGEGERKGLLRGLAAILHLGQVRLRDTGVGRNRWSQARTRD